MNHKGTLTTRPEIFTELLFDACDSLRRAGIPRLLALNGHAGNIRPVRERLEDLRARLGAGRGTTVVSTSGSTPTGRRIRRSSWPPR
jgi:creatinine amidohydrolase/Fe(II)-dependent formamide hydrolase-like protein